MDATGSGGVGGGGVPGTWIFRGPGGTDECPPPTDVSVDTALSLDGTGRLDYALKRGPKRDALLRRALQGATSDPAGPSRLEVKFRTRGKSGTLLHVQESSNYTTVKVRAPAPPGIIPKNGIQAFYGHGFKSKPMFTHALIPVNTHSRGRTLLGQWERPGCLLAWKLTRKLKHF